MSFASLFSHLGAYEVVAEQQNSLDWEHKDESNSTAKKTRGWTLYCLLILQATMNHVHYSASWSKAEITHKQDNRSSCKDQVLPGSALAEYIPAFRNRSTKEDIAADTISRLGINISHLQPPCRIWTTLLPWPDTWGDCSSSPKTLCRTPWGRDVRWGLSGEGHSCHPGQAAVSLAPAEPPCPDHGCNSSPAQKWKGDWTKYNK